MPKFEDAWKRQQFAPDMDRFTVHTPPDSGHGDKSELPNAVVMIDAPQAQPGGEICTDVYFETYRHLPPSQRIDNTPVAGQVGHNSDQDTAADHGHGIGGSTMIDPPGAVGRLRGIALRGRQRGRSDGAEIKGTTTNRSFWKYDETPFGYSIQGYRSTPMASQPGGDAVLRRGLNAYPENDGDGGRPGGWSVNTPSWKLGVYQGDNVQRDFQPPNRTHEDVRYNELRVATTIPGAPPPTVSTKYNSPFNSTAKFTTRGQRIIRGIRREPGNWDDAAVAQEYPVAETANFGGHMVVP